MVLFLVMWLLLQLNTAYALDWVQSENYFGEGEGCYNFTRLHNAFKLNTSGVMSPRKTHEMQYLSLFCSVVRILSCLGTIDKIFSSPLPAFSRKGGEGV